MSRKLIESVQLVQPCSLWRFVGMAHLNGIEQHLLVSNNTYLAAAHQHNCMNYILSIYIDFFVWFG